MSITISTKTYSKDSNPTPASAKYTGPAHTASVKDLVVLKRQDAKPTKDFAGIIRFGEKSVKSVVINGITRDCIAETLYSYPVGTAAATVTALREDHASLVGNATVSQPLVDNGKLEF